MRHILKKEFFERAPDKVAHDLVGKFLMRRIGEREVAFQITETEAYFGEEDGASHARFGLTPRNKIMYGSPGVFYIYLVYGIHFLLNITTGMESEPSAVLIRAIEECRGPGKLTKKLKIGKSLNGKEAIKKNGLWFADGPKVKVQKGPRIGIGYASARWQKALLRFYKASDSI